jgi:hypothetical protein
LNVQQQVDKPDIFIHVRIEDYVNKFLNVKKIKYVEK